MRSLMVFSILLISGLAMAAEQKVVDPAGNTVGLILDCNSCKDPGKGKDCVGGVQEGFHDGKRCGQCLITANFGTRLLYSYDLYFTGHLLRPDDKPAVNEFVRLFLPNTWTVRTRTTDDGFFRLVLGATQDRAGKEVTLDLGKRIRAEAAEATDYALYMLPENYKPCPDQ